MTDYAAMGCTPASETYELGRADERIDIEKLLEVSERKLGYLLRDYPEDKETRRAIDDIKRYRADTVKIITAGREKGWYP